MKKRVYEKELLRLQAELVVLQEWVRAEGKRVVVVFEGRDAAGKGSTIKRVTQYLNPRVARIAALPVPTERERTQWYFQRQSNGLRGRMRSFSSLIASVQPRRRRVGHGALHGR